MPEARQDTREKGQDAASDSWFQACAPLICAVPQACPWLGSGSECSGRQTAALQTGTTCRRCVEFLVFTHEYECPCQSVQLSHLLVVVHRRWDAVSAFRDQRPCLCGLLSFIVFKAVRQKFSGLVYSTRETMSPSHL